jgi:hypothetical protein
MEKVCIFTGIWYNLCPLKILFSYLHIWYTYFVVIWYIFLLFWYVAPRKIWQPRFDERHLFLFQKIK